MAGKIKEKHNTRYLVRFSLVFKTALVFICLHSGFAQTTQNPFVFKQFVDGNSTMSNIISCFMEDKDGYLWIGTAEGLKRFDGDDFTIFKHEKGNLNSLTHNEIEALCEDNEGKIWVGTGQGIGYFDKEKNQFFNFKEFDKSNNICFNIICDKNGDIWFSIRKKGLFRYSKKTKKLQNFANIADNKSSLSSNRIYQKGMILDPLNRGIWIQTEKGVNFFEFSSHQFFNKANNPKNLSIFQSESSRGFAINGNKLIFFETDSQKLIYFDVEKQQNFKEIALKSSSRKEKIDVLHIFVDKQYNLWLSDWFTYCYYLDIKTNQFYELSNDSSNPNSIASNSFWCAYQQKDGTIWLGTNNGISCTKPQKNFYQIYDISELYPPLKVRNQLYTFEEDDIDSTWWLAANAQSFVHYYPQTNRIEVVDIPKNPKCSDQFIRTLGEYQNNIFIVSTCSFYAFNKKKKELKKLFLPDSLSYKNIISHATQKGDSIWLFCNNAMAYSYKILTQRWTKYPILTNILPEQASSYPFISDIHQSANNSTLISTQSSIYCSVVDNNGDIWIAIQNTGLAKFSKQKQAFELISTKNEDEYKKISYTAMRKDKDGNFLIGTYGLVKFNPQTGTFLSVLNVNVVNDLIIDKEDRIWTAAFNDFTVLNPKTNKIINQTIPVNKGNLLWTNYLFSLKNSKIISLMRGTIAVIDPTKLIPPSKKDNVLISKVQIYGSEILLHHNASKVNLQASENVFIVYFSILNLPNENKYIYKYQLSGFQKNWTTTPNTFTSFTNLDGGNYIFKVKAIDENGFETPVSTLNIYIDTVFYKSKWFFYSCLLGIGFLVYGFVRFRVNERAKIFKLRMQSSQLEKDKTEIQYQNLINHLNPHFLFNSLTSLNSLIMTEPKAASKFLQKLSLIYRYILQNKDKEVVSLEQELGFVKHYVELQKSRFEAGLQINIDIKKIYLSHSIVPVTLQNLFENAIKHNTIEELNPLVINVFIEDDYLFVENNLQLKNFVETSNKQGLESLKSLYKYLTPKPLETIETEKYFRVKIPLL